MYIKRLILAYLLLLYAPIASAQISGQGINASEEALSFVTVSLLHAADSTLVTGVVTDMEGKFRLKTPPAGTYRLKLSAIGFVSHFTPPFEVITAGYRKDFGSIALEEDVKILEGVKVTAIRPTIVHEIDKMVISIEGTTMAAGSSAYEMIEKSPGVWVDQNGNIQLNGKGNVRIMIDGRSTYLTAKELQTMLESMSAENIKSIELISNPSAKYDAEGSSGIINLRLKKNKRNGINGMVNTGYKYNGFHAYSTNAYINLKKGKWNSNFSAESARNVRLRDATIYREFNTSSSNVIFNQKGDEKIDPYSHALRLGTDYQLNQNNSLGVRANLTWNTLNRHFITHSKLHHKQNQLTEWSNATNIRKNSGTNTAFNMHYQSKLDTTSTLYIDLNYVRLGGMGAVEFENLTQLENSDEIRSRKIQNDNPYHFDIYSAQADFTTNRIENLKLETGAKASYVLSNNLLDFYTYRQDEKVLSDSLSDHFVFREQIYAGYLTLSTTLGENWKVKAGLRAEKTFNQGKSYTLNQLNKRKYLDFFPSLFVRQKLNKHYTISYNYSRRIDRPQYDDLNPFLSFWDNYTWVEGNPYLQPQYTHSFGMTHSWKGKYNLTLEYARTNDLIVEIALQDSGDNTTKLYTENVDRKDNFSLSLLAPVRITSAWEASNSAYFIYQENLLYHEDQLLTNNQFYAYIRSNHSIILPKGLRLQVNMAYRGPTPYGFYLIKPVWWLEAGLKKSFLDDRLDISLNFNDIFRSRAIDITSDLNGNINRFDQYFSAQSIKFNLRYRFNKGEKFKSRNQNVNLDELNRAGG